MFKYSPKMVAFTPGIWYKYYTLKSCTCLCEASRTFRSLPRSGNTPKWSLPTTLKPLTAKVLAESPSVRMRVHWLELRPPASLASSSLGIPRILLDFDFWHFLLSWLWNPKFKQIGIHIFNEDVNGKKYTRQIIHF